MLIKPKPDVHEELPDGRTLPYVSEGKFYVVLEVTPGSYTIVSDWGEPVVVPGRRFDISDDSVPAGWVWRADPDQDWYSLGPPELCTPGFMERWHDGHAKERAILTSVYRRLLEAYADRLTEECPKLKS